MGVGSIMFSLYFSLSALRFVIVDLCEQVRRILQSSQSCSFSYEEKFIHTQVRQTKFIFTPVSRIAPNLYT